jgi:hypothetical protein
VTGVAAAGAVTATATLSSGPADATIGVVFAAAPVSAVTPELTAASNATVRTSATLTARDVDDHAVDELADDKVYVRAVGPGTPRHAVGTL